MKAAKYLAFALGIAAVLIAVGWHLRNTLIEKLSNPVLADYKLEIVDVSLDALATDMATIGYLELVHDKGTTIAIEDLSLPIGAASDGQKKYSASKVSVVTATREHGAPFELAILIDQLLSLPDNLAGSEISIDQFSLAPYPVVHELHWALTDTAQQIRARVSNVSLSASVNRKDANNYVVEFSLPGDSPEATEHSISGELIQGQQGIAITGESLLDLAAWEMLLSLAGILPNNIDIVSGQAALKFDAEIPYDTNQSPAVTAELLPSTEIALTHADAAGNETNVLATSGNAAVISSTFPTVEWHTSQEKMSLLVTRDALKDIPIAVDAITCRSADPGPVCSIVDATLSLEKQYLSDDIAITVSLLIEKLLISDLGGEISADAVVYAKAIDSLYKEMTLVLPGFRGQVSAKGLDIAADLTTVGLSQNGTISLRHDLNSGTGRISLDASELSFADSALSSHLSPWRWNADLNAGTVAFDMAFTWSKDFSEIDGRATIGMNGLAGYYEDIAFAGVSTVLDLAFDTATKFTIEPATLSVALIEMGFPIEDLTANYELDLDDLAVAVDALSMSAFGGAISADPFIYSSQSDSNNLVLRAELLDLSNLLSIEEFDDIEVTGSIAAELPVTIAEGSIQIVNGSMTGEAPGGVIRYRPEGLPDASDTSSIGLVRQALSNFQYEALTSEVSYTENGDLNLKMRLTGRNPDLDETRPVVLNLSVENNVPKMLKSLQAARAVEDILEQRLQE